MQKLKVLIPSYGRCGKVRALDYAMKLGAEVVISTQTESDYEEYQRRYGESASVVFRAGGNAASNRNTALMEVEDGQRALMLDDDCPLLYVCSGPRWKDVREATAEDISDMFLEMERRGCRLGGAYPVTNPLFAHKKKPISRNEMLIGAAMMFIGGELSFDETYDACEDYELCLRVVANGGELLRFNRLLCGGSGDTMKAGLTGKTNGGMATAYAGGAHGRAIRKLVRDYWPLAKLGRNGTSIQIDKRYI